MSKKYEAATKAKNDLKSCDEQCAEAVRIFKQHYNDTGDINCGPYSEDIQQFCKWTSSSNNDFTPSIVKNIKNGIVYTGCSSDKILDAMRPYARQYVEQMCGEKCPRPIKLTNDYRLILWVVIISVSVLTFATIVAFIVGLVLNKHKNNVVVTK